MLETLGGATTPHPHIPSSYASTWYYTQIKQIEKYDISVSDNTSTPNEEQNIFTTCHHLKNA